MSGHLPPLEAVQLPQLDVGYLRGPCYCRAAPPAAPAASQQVVHEHDAHHVAQQVDRGAHTIQQPVDRQDDGKVCVVSTGGSMGEGGGDVAMSGS